MESPTIFSTVIHEETNSSDGPLSMVDPAAQKSPKQTSSSDTVEKTTFEKEVVALPDSVLNDGALKEDSPAVKLYASSEV